MTPELALRARSALEASKPRMARSGKTGEVSASLRRASVSLSCGVPLVPLFLSRRHTARRPRPNEGERFSWSQTNLGRYSTHTGAPRKGGQVNLTKEPSAPD